MNAGPCIFSGTGYFSHDFFLLAFCCLFRAQHLPPKTAWDVRLFFPSTTSLPTIEALCRPDTCSWANDAELRDRSAPDVCSIATLRGPLL